MNIDILYEDNHILAVNKPPGLHTQSCLSNNLEDTLKQLIKQRDNKPRNVFLHAIHRLDQPVGGIVLFAKSQKALSRLNEASREGLFYKEYEAVVEGKEPTCGLLVDYIIHGQKIAIVTSEPQENAKRAELKIIAIKNTSPGRWKVTINLLTGRYHQIRAQLSYHGMPIVGDGKYGSSSQGNILLHHTVLQFPHPTKNETVTVTSKAHF